MILDSYYFFIVIDIQEFYELALQDESHSVTDEDISIAQKYIMDQFDAKVGLVITTYNFGYKKTNLQFNS